MTASCRHPLSHHHGHPALPEGGVGAGRLHQAAGHVGRIPEGARIAINKPPPNRYGLRHLRAARAPAMFVGFTPWLYSNGGALLDSKDRRDLHQRRKGPSRRWQFYAGPGDQIQGRAARGDDLGIRRDRRRRPERPLRHDADVRPLRHADQRSEAIEDRRQMGMATVPGRNSQDAGPHLGRWSFPSVCRNTPTTRNGRWNLSRWRAASSGMKRSMERGNAPPRALCWMTPK